MRRNWAGPPTTSLTSFGIGRSFASLPNGENEKQFSFSPQLLLVMRNRIFVRLCMYSKTSNLLANLQGFGRISGTYG